MILQVMDNQSFYDLDHLPEVKEDAFCHSEATGIHRPHVSNFCSASGGSCPCGEPRVGLCPILTLSQPQGHATSEYKTPWDSRNVQRRPHPGNPICHPDRRSLLCFQILTHASPWSTVECCHLPQPAAHSVIWSDFPLHGVGEISLGLMAPSPVASLACGVYGVEILLPGPPLMLNNGIRFRIFLFLH